MAMIPIRCDAGLVIGSGHVMRCRSLARQLRQRDHEVLFICRRRPGDLIDLLADEFPVKAMAALHPSEREAPQQDNPGTWLGCSQVQDAEDTLAAIGSIAPAAIPWLVVDHYVLSAPWHRRVLDELRRQGHKPRLLAIDDLANRALRADLLLDQNRLDRAAALEYAPLLPPGCRCLLGPQHALLGDEFAVLHPLLPERSAPVQRLLLFFGGADLNNLSERCLEALLLPQPLPLKIDVVLGTAYAHRDRIEALVSAHPRVRLHPPQPSLAGLIAQADLALGAGGVTSWERACLGLPALVTSLAANQDKVIEQLAQTGAVVDLGPARELGGCAVRQAVQALLETPEALRERSRRARAITDGLGARRVVAAMLGPRLPFSLRPATASHEDIWLRWANDPVSRAASFCSDPISPQEHHRWFGANLSDPDALLLIAHASDQLPLGYARFHRVEPEANSPRLLASVALEPALRGQGLAVPLLREALALVQERWGHGCQVLAEIKPNNLASIRSFEKAGFKPCTPWRPEALCFRWVSL